MFVLNPEWTDLDFTDPDGFHIGIREALQLSAGIWFGKTNTNSILATIVGGCLVGQYSPFYVYPLYSFYEAIKAKAIGNTPKTVSENQPPQTERS
ncbi:MAG: hypothetical protein KKA31_00145 [Candidatus Margulisbacteria bacterium]|nr:hypothetical protein [Candidatus Margulisiibacteriota bacterium]